MKVFIDCGCLMLQKSLEMFLSEYIASYDECDMVISDEEKDTPKPLFLVGDENGDLKMPFNKDILVEKLLEYDRIIKFNANLSQNEEFQKLQTASNLQNSSNLTDLSNSQNSLEDRISDLIDNFKDELIKIIKESKN